jgi:hypothetical protein
MTANNAQTGPKAKFYRSKHDGQVYPALRTPSGYEDQHPELFEPVDGDSYDAASDKDANERVAKDAADAGIDKSGYMSYATVQIPGGSAQEPIPAASLVYGNPGRPSEATPLPGRNDGGQVVIGGADRDQVRLTGEPASLPTGVTNPAEVAQKQIAANEQAKEALANPPAAGNTTTTAPTAPAPTAAAPAPTTPANPAPSTPAQ